MGELSSFEKQQLNQAKQTLMLPDNVPLIYPGLTKDRAREIVRRYRKPKNWLDRAMKVWDNRKWNRT